MEYTAYHSHLKRAGLVLVVVGVIDIAVMIYCIASGISYSSSVNIFAVIAGVFLLRGSLRAASAIRWLTAFMLAALFVSVFAWPFMQPLELALTQLRLAPAQSLFSIVLMAFFAALLGWLYRQLGTNEILTARAAAGRKVRDLRIPAAIGAGLVGVMTVAIPLFLDSETGVKAKTIAQRELGTGFKYHVSSLHVSKTSQGTFVAGVVTAWNEREIRTVPVRWQE